jgi:pilus assembly protein Flp/PilA
MVPINARRGDWFHAVNSRRPPAREMPAHAMLHAAWHALPVTTRDGRLRAQTTATSRRVRRLTKRSHACRTQRTVNGSAVQSRGISMPWPIRQLPGEQRAMTRRFLARLWDDESGATAIEYGILVALMSVATITAMSNIGFSVRNNFNSVGTALALTAQAEAPPD